MRRRAQTRGFSLLEMMIAMVILVVAGGIAIPYFTSLRRDRALHTQARLLVARFAKARSLAASGQRDSSWGEGARTVNAGVRIVSSTGYELFIDRNGETDGDEVVVERVDFAEVAGGIPIEFADFGGEAIEVRYKANGALETPTQETIDITLRDSDSERERVVRVTYSGLAKIHL